ncbi:MAG: hypothetical protein KKG33_09055 [candidate division Zixibacteria bacterium]|nr:hypothetical protein [candidate division Zixibacteria bacterium]MBU1471854.1 hypothetical protein [candidate division Zixibacteria bacterium]MBU2625696.1 hypothetical protein [candidate division Zixibacteria bacterium]
MSVTALADVGFDFSCTHIDAGNLFNDSTDITDAYTTASSTIFYYPHPKTEITFNNNYAYYRDRLYLGYFSSGGGVTYIPTSEGAKFQLYSSGSFTGMLYRKGMSDFDNNTFDLSVSIGYKIDESVRIRQGLSYKSTAYTKSESSDQESFEMSFGGNFRLLGSNVVDLELGYAFANFDFIYPTDAVFPKLGLPARITPDGRFYGFTDGQMKSVYFSPRYSRPIGPKTGLAITYTYREFFNTEDAVLLGITSGDISAENLSPWSSVWQGRAVTLMLKTYVFPKMIVSAGVGYWNKVFLRTYYGEDGIDYFFQVTDRHDDKSKFYISIQDPILMESGVLVETTISADYTNNTSSKPLYDYSGLSVSIGFRVHM